MVMYFQAVVFGQSSRACQPVRGGKAACLKQELTVNFVLTPPSCEILSVFGMEVPQKFFDHNSDLEEQRCALDELNMSQNTVNQCRNNWPSPGVEIKPVTNWFLVCCKATCRERYLHSKLVIPLCIMLFLILGLILLLWNYYCIIIQHYCDNYVDNITPHLTKQPAQEDAGILIQEPTVSR
ncbi:uncharacterized protein LOC144502587 [Mustelus asterias]